MCWCESFPGVFATYHGPNCEQNNWLSCLQNPLAAKSFSVRSGDSRAPCLLCTGMLAGLILCRQPQLWVHESRVLLCSRDTVILFSPWFLALTVFASPLLQWSLSLIQKGYDTDVPFVTESHFGFALVLNFCVNCHPLHKEILLMRSER